jgi:uncharacterized protein (TIGR02001 family)
MRRRPINRPEAGRVFGAALRNVVAVVAVAAAIAGMTLLIGSQAWAQASGSVSIVSDYRFRGVSLSDGRAEPQVHLGYDGKSGWYGGAFASGVVLAGDEDSNAQLMAYGGYSRRHQSAFAWEVGATKSVFTQAARYNYTEIFAGLSSEHISGRVYFSPDYFGAHARTLYAEVNGSYPVRERLQLLGHIGFLRLLSGAEKSASGLTNRFDMRAGVSASLGEWKIQIAWVAAEKTNHRSRFYEGSKPRTWVLDASYAF